MGLLTTSPPSLTSDRDVFMAAKSVLRGIMKGLVAILILAGLGGAALVVDRALERPASAVSAPQPVPVQVAAAQREPFVDSITAVGTGRAREAVTITATVTEKVVAVRFEEGARVEAGAVLIELTHDEEEARLRETQARLDEARHQQTRIEELVSRGNASDARRDEVRAETASLAAQIEAIQAQIKDRIIRAPFSGIIGLRQISPGALVEPGTAVATLDDLSLIKVDFSVPETFLAGLASGQEISAHAAPYPDETFSGKVTLVGTRIDPVTRAVQLRAEIPNSDHRLKPGMLLTVEVVKSRAPALTIPEQALVPLGDRQFVFVVGDENRVSRTEVRIGRRQPGKVEIIDGLSEGDRVVTEGTIRIRDGSAVRVVGETGV